MPINILAIESSCDDTSAAVISDGEVLSNIVSVQTAHADYGGVIPELASREHQIHIVPVVEQALKKAEIDKKDLSAIAFTRGPGLLGSLIVGVSFAKSMALSLDIPLIDVHHMHAHVMAHFAVKPHPTFPFLCLTVSGGHTQIIKVTDYNEMEILGQTIDDAAGEAFDKTGKMLGLTYPAGPLIDKHAQQGDPIYKFPISRVDKLNFSFSGLKTAILYFLRENVNKDPQFIEKELNNICASVQTTIVETLMLKLIKATEETGITSVSIAGGVSANSEMRQRLLTESKERGWECYIPDFEYCRDNAAMIGVSGYYKYLKGEFCGQDVKAEARLEF
ncbi:tRNA (adenosine(37)-N6)-threonylcarbamoyltransferase complex transferase subunit TsaD [Saprospiraceae bacterium]|nr:tRNA (adenosine(37)-N6)-threonylcarbamoyltransferase complex transferase subunit TsaD [Saprospiraceae bacterium]